MGRLYNKVLYAIINCTLKCLIHIVDLLIVSCLYMVDDDLCSKCSSYCPVRISCLQCILDALDILGTAVIEGSTKAYNQDLIVTNLICIPRIILGSITCIASEVLRACLFALYQLLLCIGQCIPCFLCSGAVCIRCIGSFLYVNFIDQSCNIVSSCLICIFCAGLRCCLCNSLCLLCIDANRAYHRKCGCCHHHYKCFYYSVFHVFFLLNLRCTFRIFYYPMQRLTDKLCICSPINQTPLCKKRGI